MHEYIHGMSEYARRNSCICKNNEYASVECLNVLKHTYENNAYIYYFIFLPIYDTYLQLKMAFQFSFSNYVF